VPSADGFRLSNHVSAFGNTNRKMLVRPSTIDD